MPETPFTIELPDSKTHRCYSPSSIVRKFFAPEQTFTNQEFVETATEALTEADRRVREVFGAG